MNAAASGPKTSTLRLLAWGRLWSPLAGDDEHAEAWHALDLPGDFTTVRIAYWNAFHVGNPQPPVTLLLHGLLGRDGAVRRDVRAWAAATFGLLHGFGFASVLREMALPGTGAAQAWALAGFNVGVEIGQLFVVAVVTVPLMLLRRHSHAIAERVVYAASACVVAAGGWWFLERTFLSGGV